MKLHSNDNPVVIDSEVAPRNPKAIPGAPETMTCTRPRTRQRVYKAPAALNVPDINEDADERKRVLNVLAQRRYRQRKRQARKSLDSEGRRKTVPEDQAQTSSSNEEVHTSQAAEIAIDGPARCDLSPFISLEATAASEGTVSDIDYTLGLVNCPSQRSGPVREVDPSPPSAAFECMKPDQIASSDADSFALQCSSSLKSLALDLDLDLDLSKGYNSDLSKQPSAGQHPGHAPYIPLPLPGFATLQAFVRMAIRLGCPASLWDLAANSPFSSPGPIYPKPFPQTSSWQPTASQVLVPHHPLLDMFPWPSVRDRAIAIFSLPSELRPPAASGPLGIAQFFTDLHDADGGLRIHDDNICSHKAWEVGQLVYERWWFLFDRDIVEQSNRWRQRRGMAKLTLDGPLAIPASE